MGPAMTDCLFCRIVSREVPSTPVAESDAAYAFRDIAPAASAHHLEDADAELMGELVLLAQEVARLEGIDGPDRGYRLVMNVGPDAQMSVPHLHLHVLGGHLMGWPPG